EMISSVALTQSEFKAPPHRFEAGTPAIAQSIGLGCAANYLDEIGRQRIFEHDQELALRACSVIEQIPGAKIFGRRNTRARVVSFVRGSIHAHDVVSMADQYGLALRGGHHCTQPLLRKLGVPATARASFYFYNTPEEIIRMGEVLRKIHAFFACTSKNFTRRSSSTTASLPAISDLFPTQRRPSRVTTPPAATKLNSPSNSRRRPSSPSN